MNGMEQIRLLVIYMIRRYKGAEAKYISGYEQSTKIRPNHYEVWFAPDALQ